MKPLTGLTIAVLVAACGPSSSQNCPTDASTPVDGSPDASSEASDGEATVTYNNPADPTRWETFDSTKVEATARGFTGEAYDGRYVYYVPYDTNTRSGLVLRYDPTAPFSLASSWTAFDLSTLDAAALGYVGPAFDGRYLYFAQFNNGTDYSGRIARYDTMGTFDTPLAWTIFDVSTVNAGSIGFAGAVFDGRYVYFVPHYNTGYDGLVTRYDTQADFSLPAAWTTFDLATTNPAARGFVSGTFDGRYVYLTPYETEAGYSSMFARFDTKGSFTDPGAWSSFDTTAVDPNAIGYKGAIFDGHYVYFVPTYNLGGGNGDVVRFDTTAAAFTDTTAWVTFDISTVNPAAKSYSGGVFDGRYITLVPNGEGAPQGVLARYDTLASFASAASWITVDLTTISPDAKEFYSGGFDGRYFYIAEYWDGTQPTGLMMRFDAKSPPSIPAAYSPPLTFGVASFF